MPKKLPYLKSYNGYNYLRFPNQKPKKLPGGEPQGSAFMAAYKKALAAAEAMVKSSPEPLPRSKKNGPVTGPTVRDHVTGYFASPDFKILAPNTQDMRRHYLLGWCDGSQKKGLEAYGENALIDLTPEIMLMMLENRQTNIGAARNWLVAVRVMLTQRRKVGALPKTFDPTWGLRATIGKPKRRKATDGFRVWDAEQMDLFREHWLPGTMQRLAFDLIYRTGAACADVVKLSRSDIIDGQFAYDRTKTETPSYAEV